LFIIIIIIIYLLAFTSRAIVIVYFDSYGINSVCNVYQYVIYCIYQSWEFSCTFWVDFRIDAHRSLLAARILATPPDAYIQRLWRFTSGAFGATLRWHCNPLELWVVNFPFFYLRFAFNFALIIKNYFVTNITNNNNNDTIYVIINKIRIFSKSFYNYLVIYFI